MRVSPVLEEQTTYPFVTLERAKRETAARGIEIIDFGQGDPREPTDPRIRRLWLTRAAERWRTRRRRDCPSCARRSPRGAVAGSASSSILTASSSRRTAARRRSSASPRSCSIATAARTPSLVHRARVSRLRARRGVRRRQSRARSAARGERVPSGSRRDPRRDARAHGAALDQLSEQPDRRPWRRRRSSSASARAGRTSTTSCLPRTRRTRELWFDEPPRSALSVADRTNVVVFNTLSKRSSMTGYRSGFVAGDPGSSTRCKRSGRPSARRRRSSSSARRSSPGTTRSTSSATRERYRRKRELLLDALERAGCASPAARRRCTSGSRCPRASRPRPSQTRLLEHGVVVAPGSYFGPSGEGYVRIALVPTVEDCDARRAILEDALCGRSRRRELIDRARPRASCASPSSATASWVVERGGEAGDPRLLPAARGRADRGRAVRLPGQDPAQARLRRRGVRVVPPAVARYGSFLSRGRRS